MVWYRKIFYIVCFLFLCFQCADADTVYLKNGNKIEGSILSETENEVTVNIGHGATVVQSKEFIERVERSVRKQKTDATTADNLEKELSVVEILKLIRGTDDIDKLMMYLSNLDQQKAIRLVAKVFFFAGAGLLLVFIVLVGGILFIMCRINDVLPFGVKLARALLLFTLIFMGGIFSVFLILFIPNMRILPSLGIFLPLLGVILFQILFFKILHWMFVNLAKFNPLARKVQIVFSILGLLNFPVSTVLNVIILYSFFKKENKELFLQTN